MPVYTIYVDRMRKNLTWLDPHMRLAKDSGAGQKAKFAICSLHCIY